MSDDFTRNAERHAHKTFGQLVETLDGGKLGPDVNDALIDLTATLQNHVLDYGGKPAGTITVKLGMKLVDGVMEIVPTLTVKKPEIPRGKALRWATPGNLLTPVNPDQASMDFTPRTVIPATTESKIIEG